MLENIYISRHGFRSNWVDSSITTSVTGMSRDPPLAAHGLDQAEELAVFLANPPSGEGLPVPELIFSSPFFRCVQTASYTAKRLGMPLKLEHGVQEWIEAEYPNVKSVAIFAHAASVIALGRSLTGDKTKEIRAGCATTSFYRRKAPSTSNNAAQPEAKANKTSFHPPANGKKSTVGCWDCLWDGRADYLTQGEERNWSFQDIILNAEGHVISDRGDGNPVKPGDDQPIGLAPGMEKYLTREDVYSPLKRGNAVPVQDIERAVLSMTAETSAKDTRPRTLQRKSSGAMIESRM
ncbi:hypothetical protein QFC21_005443 [Naganishia friedmannii]|uniref:Uncharacterized protein n=1 Tax=Naganishia friedmannii TaxID=89922 RepID=A0ACC2VAH3_9TREE|nr:hypothetical protein QFC21_005443 [Naganishia friedmannii]